MIAARYWAPQDVRVEHVAEPQPGAGEVVLRVEAALTCGTDAKCYRRGHPVLLGPPPAPFGHEYAGVVVACGEDAPFADGDRVCGVELGALRRLPRLPGRPRGAVRRPLPAAQRRLRRAAARARAHRAREPAPRARRASRPRWPRRSSRWPAPCTAPTTPASAPGVHVAIVGRGPLGRLLALACEARGATAELLGRGEGEPRSFETVIEAAGTPEAWEQRHRAGRPGRHRRAVRRPAARTRSCPWTATGCTTRRSRCAAPSTTGRATCAPRSTCSQRASASIATLLTHEFALADVVEPLRRAAGLAPRDGLLKAVIRP